MVELRKREPRRHPAKTPPSRKARDRPRETTATAPRNSKPRRSEKTSAPPKGEDIASVRIRTAPAQLPVLLIGGKVPSETLASKVLLDDGSETSLGEQLENSRPGGLIVFVYDNLTTDEVYDFAMEFDYRQVNYESAQVSMVGLSPHSVVVNQVLKADKGVYFSLLSDPESKLINTLGFNFSKGGKKVGAFAMDKERDILTHSFGKLEKVLGQLDRDMDGLMEEIEES